MIPRCKIDFKDNKKRLDEDVEAAAQALNASEFTVNLAVEKVDFGSK